MPSDASRKGKQPQKQIKHGLELIKVSPCFICGDGPLLRGKTLDWQARGEPPHAANSVPICVFTARDWQREAQEIRDSTFCVF